MGFGTTLTDWVTLTDEVIHLTKDSLVADPKHLYPISYLENERANWSGLEQESELLSKIIGVMLLSQWNDSLTSVVG